VVCRIKEKGVASCEKLESNQRKSCVRKSNAVTVCESKEKLRDFFFSHKTYTKAFEVSFRKFVEC
jgi:predicted Holliday junction resolvase-like endonuclease